MLLLFILVGILIITGVAIGLATRSAPSPDEFCPHSYADFGCQPCCPLYEHCWDKRED